METSKISFLCKLSDRIFDNAKKAQKFPVTELTGLTIRGKYSQTLNVDFDDYPELKPVAEKLLDYIVKSEESKQNEIKIEIARIL